MLCFSSKRRFSRRRRRHAKDSHSAGRQALKETVMDTLATVKLFYSLLSAGDNSGALQLLDPQIEWTESERTPYFTGTMIGPDAVIAGLFAPLARDFENFTTT